MKSKLIWLLPVAPLGIALLHMPYGYYMLLRLLICAICFYLVVLEREIGGRDWPWILGACGVLYNPIFKVPLARETWQIVNLATIVLLLLHMWQFLRRSSAAPAEAFFIVSRSGKRKRTVAPRCSATASA